MSARRFLLSATVITLSLMCLVPARAGELEQAFGTQLKRAQTGDVQAMYALGEMYELGMGTDNSRGEALNWYRAAADEGHAGGAYQVGYAYYWGKGVGKDRREAHVWFLRAAEGGNQAAIPYLSKMYALGQGVPQDKGKAAAWAARADTSTNLHRPLPKPETQRSAASERPQTVQQTAPVAPPAPAKAVEVEQPPPSAPRVTVKAEPQPVARPEPKRAAPPKPKPRPRQSTSERNIERLLASQWEKGKRPALYLPSTETTCGEQEGRIACLSTPRRSSLLGRPYAFRLVAELTDFDDKDNFALSYRLEVTGVLQAPPGAYADDASEAITEEQLRERVERAPEQLRCTLQDAKALTCTDGKGQEQQFTGVTL